MTDEDITTKHTPTPEAPLQHLLDDDPFVGNPHTSPVPVLPQLTVALSILILIFGVTFITQGTTKSAPQVASAEDVRVDARATTPKTTLSSRKAFDGVELEAESAIVWDMTERRVLFNKNADDVRALASITKLMTTLIAYELLSPEDIVPITLEALGVEGDSGFVDGETFTAQNLNDLVLITSSNDGAAALALGAGARIDEKSPREAFITAMNLRAQELGLSKTVFRNSSGLDVSDTVPGGEGTAREVALLMDYIVTNVPDLVEFTDVQMTTITNTSGAYHLAENTNPDINEMTGLIASKTGFTPLAQGNLVVALNAGLHRPVVIVVLGSSSTGRFRDTELLIDRTMAYMSNE